MAFNSRAGGKGSAKRPSDVSMETFDNNFDRIFGKKNKVNTDAAQDVFELSPSGYEKAKAFLKENGLEDQIQKEQSTDGFTLVALANKLYKDKTDRLSVPEQTTIQLEGDLLKEIQAVALDKNCTTENLVEAALIQFVAEQKQLQEEVKKDNGGNTDIE